MWNSSTNKVCLSSHNNAKETSSWYKVFARKIIQGPDKIANELINEKRLIEKCQVNGGHKNIIQVLAHGRLTNEHYFIDMDLCALSLREFLNGRCRSALGSRLFNPHDYSDGLECLSFWSIVTQVAQGLEFIHDKGELHRDIKPENSKFPIKLAWHMLTSR